jgi:hypothetical protein
MTNKRLVLRNFTLMFFLGISTVSAQSPSSSGAGSDSWEYVVSPYLIFASMNGTSAVRGREVEVDVSPSDIFENLQFGAMGYFGARKGNWGFGVDALYMALGVTIDTPPANIDPGQGAFTFMGTRKLNEKVDAVFGARWNFIQGKIEFTGPLNLTVEQTKHWVDPLVGLNLHHKLGERWLITLQGDIGGFGAGSDFAWHLFPVVEAAVGKRASLAFGYRVLGMNYETGSGSELFKYDVITSGPVLGMTFRF